MKLIIRDNRDGRLYDEAPLGDPPFGVGPDLEWVEVADDVSRNTHYFVNGVATELPPPPPLVVDTIPGTLDVIQLLLTKQLLAPADLRQEWRDLLGV